MKLLYVGCRVRIIISYDYPELSGTEGIIIARADDPEYTGENWAGWGKEQYDWVVSPDLWGQPFKTEEGVEEDGSPYVQDLYFTPSSDQLEPVLPDGLLESIQSEEIESEILREQALVTAP